MSKEWFILSSSSVNLQTKLVNFSCKQWEKTKSRVSNFYYVGIAGQIATIWPLCYPINKSLCFRAGAKRNFVAPLHLSVSAKSLITDLDALSLDIKPVQLLSNNELLLIKPKQLQKSL